jgi:disulfide bond formation protein DsbB
MTAFAAPNVQAAALAGATSLALVVGALLFQAAGLPPCEMCHWQRWPHAAAAVLGLGAALLALAGTLSPRQVRVFALLAIAALALSGAIGVFHAGVEWKFWPGPTACTGGGYVPGVSDDASFRVVRCDVAAWRLLGLSLAGYNALISLGIAGLCLALLSGKNRHGDGA